MGARLIRDDLLESERVLKCTPETRWLYVSILLSADDIGLFEATPFKLARKADLDRDRADAMLAELVENDLVRLYKHAGKQYGFVPRFKQRLQIKRAKHPLPPENVLHDDADALKKINHLTSNPTVDHGETTVTSRKSTVGQPPEPEPKRKRNPPTPKGEVAGFDRFWAAWPKSPRKGGLDKCRQLWVRNKLEDQADAILAHVTAMAATQQWQKEGGQYVPGPVVYLRSTAWTGADLTGGISNFTGAI